MKSRTSVQCLATVVGLTLVWVMWPVAKPSSVERMNPRSASTEMPEEPGWHRTVNGAPRMAARSGQIAPPPNETRVNTAWVLAKVNQTPIQLRDLMPVRPGETDKDLTTDEYGSRLQRAIETELAFQAARAQGVELTVAQWQRLEQVGARHQADLDHYRNYGLSWSSISPEQVEFEKRLMAAQMLEQNLVAKRAAAAPSAAPEMQARYEQARRELFEQLQASANVTKTLPAR